MEKEIEIYAELSKKQYNKIVSGEYSLQIPQGTSLKNRKGSRALYFSCDSKMSANQLINGLDNSFISWQKN